MEQSQLLTLQSYFYTNGSREVFPRRKIIILQGDHVDDVFLVIKGMYKVYNIDENGEERTIMLSGDNSLMPISWQPSLQTGNGVSFFYEAYTDMIAYRVGTDKFKDMLKQNADVALYLLDAATKTNISLESRVQSLQRSKIEEKTEFILYYLAKRLGKTYDGHIFEIKKPITQQDIANLAGVNRETAARFLLSIYANRISWKAGSNYYIDIAKLHAKYKAPVYS